MTESELRAEIAHTKAEIARKTAECDRLAREYAASQDENSKLRGEQRDRRHDNKGLADQLAALTAERDQYKTKAEMTGADWQAKIDEADRTISQLKHQKVFSKVAQAFKVNDPAKLADLIKLASYQPETGEPDEVKIAAAFQETIKSRPWLQDTPAPPPVAPMGTNGHHFPPGPGSDRGVSISGDSGGKPVNRIVGRL